MHRRAGARPGDAGITFVAVPVLAVADQVKRALAETTGVVTDVGSVKGAIAAAVDDPRFVGGHPMAGSELDGLDGADAAMFSGAVWVLTPVAHTADATFATVAASVADLGAEVVAMAPERHDEMVAVVSHVPHLTAATLMGLAADRAEEHAALLRLAAGGFRDMTRIASGHPEIWLDICAENRPAILSALDGLIDGLTEMRDIVGDDDRAELHERLQRARDVRTNLPSRVTHPEELAEVRIPIPDRPGAAAEVFTLAAELGVNIASFEVVHTIEGRGVAVVLIDAGAADLYRGGLIARGFRPAVQPLVLMTDARAACEPAGTAGRDAASPSPARRASPTGRSCAPRSPTARVGLSRTSPTATTRSADESLLAFAARHRARRRGDELTIVGIRRWRRTTGPATLDARLAGTTSRFLTAVAALGTAPITIDGSAPLRNRPMAPLHEALAELRRRRRRRPTRATCPVTVTGPPLAAATRSRCPATCPASTSRR